MGQGRGNGTRKNIKHGFHPETKENFKTNRQQELLNSQVVVINGKHSKKSPSRPDSHVDQEGDVIFKSLNLPRSSLSINLPSYSHLSLSIRLPPVSHSSLSLEIPSAHSDSDSVFPSSSSSSSNTPPPIKDDVNCVLHGKKDLKKVSQDQILTSPVLDFVQESYPLDLNSIANYSPPTHQVMDRSGGGGGHDPSRIPLTIFERIPSSPVDWSAASNDSLFSLQLGRNNSNSFSRDGISSVDELSKSGDVEVASAPPPPISMSEIYNWSPVPSEENSQFSIDIDRVEAFGVADDVEKVATRKVSAREADEDMKKEQKMDSDASSKFTANYRTSHRNGDSSRSFAFPILADGERTNGPQTNAEKQHMLQLLNEQHAKASVKSPQAPKASTKSASSSWYCCCSLSLGGCFWCCPCRCSSCCPSKCCYPSNCISCSSSSCHKCSSSSWPSCHLCSCCSCNACSRLSCHPWSCSCFR
eukprot:XP_015584532.1 uncharacterized protein LOC8264708 [Ricinus communis]